MSTKQDKIIAKNCDSIVEAVLRWERGEYDDEKLRLNIKSCLTIVGYSSYSEGYQDCEDDFLENVK